MRESQESKSPSPALELSFKQILKLHAKNTPLVSNATDSGIIDNYKILFHVIQYQPKVTQQPLV